MAALLLLLLVLAALFLWGYISPKPFDPCTCAEADRCRHAQNFPR